MVSRNFYIQEIYKKGLWKLYFIITHFHFITTIISFFLSIKKQFKLMNDSGLERVHFNTL